MKSNLLWLHFIRRCTNLKITYIQIGLLLSVATAQGVHRSVSPRVNGRRLNPEKRLTKNGGAIGKSSYDEVESDDDVRYRLATPSIEEVGKDSAVESSGEDETQKRYERKEKIRNPTQLMISNNGAQCGAERGSLINGLDSQSAENKGIKSKNKVRGLKPTRQQQIDSMESKTKRR